MKLNKPSVVDENSKIPKYKQIINAIMTDIHQGLLKPGQKIPSINETSFEYYLSRDTVEKAYKELRQKGIIESVRGKGFYVSEQANFGKPKVLLLFNKISTYKKIVYNAFIEELDNQADVELKIHHYETSVLENILEQGIAKYSYIVLIPHFLSPDEKVRPIIRQIPASKLLLLDRLFPGLKGEFGSIYQDFSNDISQALQDAFEHLKKYKRLVLVFSHDDHYSPEIISGLKTFCLEHKIPCSVISDTEQQAVEKGDVYIVIKETDLVDVVKKAKEKDWVIGKDLGIISYNETPLKEVLCDGISVITTDFEAMGRTAAKMILSKERSSVKNPFRFIQRNSL